MDLLLTDEQVRIVESIRDVLRHEFALERLQAGDPPFGDGACSRWSMLAGLGWFGLGLAEAAGGLGLSVAEEALLSREAGRHGVTPGLLATLLAAHAAHATGRDHLAAGFVAGTERAGLLMAAAPPAPGEARPVYLADAEHGGWLVGWSARELWLVERDTLRDRLPARGLDALVPMQQATLALERGVLRGGAALALRADVLVAAMLTGLAEASRDMAVAYAKVREQFGRPIGGFQALQHRCADMAVACEAAACQTLWAALEVARGAPEAAREAAAARLLAQRAAEDNAAANIQIHGAMGFTDEAAPHRFLKRALLLRHTGDPAGQHEALLG